MLFRSTGSFIRGIAHRASPATVHANIRVIVPDYLVDIEGSTNANGDYLIGRIPQGTWNILYADNAASQAAGQSVTVPTLPDTVTAPLITLAPLPPGQALRVRPAAMKLRGRR